MNRLLIATATSVALLLIASSALAEPTEIGFAGRIALTPGDDGEVLEPPANVELRFRIMEGNNSLFDETHEGVTVTDGLVFAALGRVDPGNNPLDDSVFSGAKLELEITVDGEVLEPRLELLSVPYASRAGRAAVADVADRIGDLEPADIARVDHNHDLDYLPSGGVLACTGNDKVVGFDAVTGSVLCAADIDTDTDTSVTAAANGGLVRTGNEMSIANNSVTSAMIFNNSLGQIDLGTDSVGALEIASGAVRTAEVLDNSLTAADLAPNSVGTSEVANNSLTAFDLAPSSVLTSEIADNTIRRSDLNGTEISIRRRAQGCSNPGTLDTASTCITVPCIPPLFESCAGSCNRTSAAVCTLPVVAIGLSPSML